MRGKDVGQSEADESTTSYITKKNLAEYMKKDSYKGYTKEPTDFYSVFDKLFKKLDEEEEMEESVGKYHNAGPTFGKADATK